MSGRERSHRTSQPAAQPVTLTHECRFPDHAIIGEEFGTKGDPETSEWCWVLDPIDGTRDYTVGTHTWGTLIGLTRHHRPVVGIVDQPCQFE